MDQELKAKWVAALRSGTYTQGRAKLKDEAGAMCCLGVLREIIEPGCEEVNDDEGEYLPSRFHTATGLAWVTQDLLAGMNDGNELKRIKRHSFAEIANWIEANL